MAVMPSPLVPEPAVAAGENPRDYARLMSAVYDATMAGGQLGAEGQLLRLARWETGIVLASDDGSRSVESVARRQLCWAAREPGSAARDCLDELLGGRDCPGRQVDEQDAVGG